MALSVYCPNCNRPYRVKEELAGRRARCPAGHLLVVPEGDKPGGRSPVAKLDEASTDVTRDPPVTRRCPYCGEEILAIAKKCKHCGEFFNELDRPAGVQSSRGSGLGATRLGHATIRPLPRSWDQLRRIADRQRALISGYFGSAIGVAMLITVLDMFLKPSDEGRAIIILICGLIFWIFTMSLMIGCLNSLGIKNHIQYIIGSLLPFGSPIVLLVVNEKLTAALRSAGIRVGFIGTHLPEHPPPNDSLTSQPIRAAVGHEEAPVEAPNLEPSTSILAILSLVLGVTSLVGLCLTGIPAIILGKISLDQIDNSAGELGGRGLANWGIYCGTFGSLYMFLLALMATACGK